MAFVYRENASVEIRTRVVPVSTTPAVEDNIAVLEVPYVMLCSIPQKVLEGDVFAVENEELSFRGM